MPGRSNFGLLRAAQARAKSSTVPACEFYDDLVALGYVLSRSTWLTRPVSESRYINTYTHPDALTQDVVDALETLFRKNGFSRRDNATVRSHAEPRWVSEDETITVTRAFMPDASRQNAWLRGAHYLHHVVGAFARKEKERRAHPTIPAHPGQGNNPGGGNTHGGGRP